VAVSSGRIAEPQWALSLGTTKLATDLVPCLLAQSRQQQGPVVGKLDDWTDILPFTMNRPARFAGSPTGLEMELCEEGIVSA
jgi:hypothetical protein